MYLESIDKQAVVTFEKDYCCFCFRLDRGDIDSNTYSVSRENIENLKIKDNKVEIYL